MPKRPRSIRKPIASPPSKRRSNADGWPSLWAKPTAATATPRAPSAPTARRSATNMSTRSPICASARCRSSKATTKGRKRHFGNIYSSNPTTRQRPSDCKARSTRSPHAMPVRSTPCASPATSTATVPTTLRPSSARTRNNNSTSPPIAAQRPATRFRALRDRSPVTSSWCAKTRKADGKRPNS